MIRCQHCDSENVRIQGQATLSAPGELMHQFSKSNLRRKDVYLMGVNWETFDVICGDCSRVTPAYGNYVSRMEKEVERLTARVEALEGVIQCAMQTTIDHRVRDVLDTAGIELAATEQETE